MNEEVKRDFAELEETTGRADAVIVGDLGAAFGYEVLNHAFRRVMGGAELIALQKNRYWMRADGLSLDVGPFVAAIEFASGREAYVVGKPAKGFFDQVLASVGVEASAAAMVGDDIESDIGGALRAGLTRSSYGPGSTERIACASPVSTRPASSTRSSTCLGCSLAEHRHEIWCNRSPTVPTQPYRRLSDSREDTLSTRPTTSVPATTHLASIRLSGASLEDRPAEGQRT